MYVFFILFLLVVGASAGYTGYRMWLWTSEWFALLRVVVQLVWLTPLLLFVILLLGRGRLADWLSVFCYAVSTSWLFVLMYGVLACLVIDLVALVFPLLRDYLLYSPFVFLCLVLLLGSLFVLGNLIYQEKERVEIEVVVDKPLDREYRIVGLADLHLGATIGRGELAEWVDLVNGEAPDLVVVSGDVVDNHLSPLMRSRAYEEFHRLRAPLGVYCCLGNHEYLAGLEGSLDFLSRTGMTVLRDSVALVDGGLYVVGRDDYSNSERTALTDLVAGLDETLPVIVLDHQPRDLAHESEAGHDVQFSGHTHAGQLFPVNLIVRSLYECSHGRLDIGRTCFLVTSGIGIWGGKFRLGTRSEYVVIRLRGGDSVSGD